MILLQNLVGPLGWTILGVSLLVIFGLIVMLISWYKKVPQGKAIIRTGVSGTKVAIENGIIVVPGIQMHEIMDLSVRTIEISRMKEDGLICKDNIRADTKVVFFVRINKEVADIKKVAQSIGCQRASDIATLRELFEAKFSEAIKTVGKRFDFVELYDSREKFNSEIQNAIGLNLNGYILEDASIDYLEQTDISYLKENNILDAEGIKKITELTAQQKVKANYIRREEEKTITEQNTEAREAILEYERQLTEKEERQKREIANIRAREAAEIAKISEEERLRAEMVRIKTEEELQVAEENRMRQVIIALKNKERTEAIEQERVEKDRMLEQTEREKIVTLAEIEKQRAVEEEKKNIQDVIRDRIMVEKKVVEQEEVIKDTKVLAEAERLRQKEVIEAQAKGEATVIEQQKQAEAAKLAAEINAEKLLIDAEAEKNAAEKEAEARKIQAEATAAEEATIGLSEAQVIEAKAKAKELEGTLEASVLERKAKAEALGIEAKAEAFRKQGRAEAEVADEKGQAEARVLGLKFSAEAKGIEQKANAMKELDGVGREHEEFKLRLETEKEIQLANIDVSRDIAHAQSEVLGEAMKHANIDIVGGEMQFVNSILNAVQRGKSIDGLINNSSHLNNLSQNLLPSAEKGGEGLLSQVGNMIRRSGLSMTDIKDLTLTALLMQLSDQASDDDEQNLLKRLLSKVQELGIGALKAGQLL
ncbi:MAG: flotillin family protein [Phaeodactylibacter sp.]|nr:flotillin family protein [Phaeodactylibacter sp.]